jgi:2-polyprenyl-3-methyl-5-hydroxy-6-metoxy-1,4-benzoquinol methylase
MLHQIELEKFGRVPDALVGAEAHHERFQQRLALSRQTPYRWFAKANTALYLGGVFIAGALASVFRRRVPDTVDRELGEAYAYVPEMAIHKKIELKAYLKQDLAGDGVDLGAGSGIVGGILKRHSRIRTLHGVDMMPQTEIAEANGYDGYTGASIDDMPLPDKSFDFAVSICVLEHVPNLRAVIREAARVLKPEGLLLFSTPTPRFREATLRYQLLRLLGMVGTAKRLAADEDLRCMHYHYLTKEEWCALLSDSGFDAITIEPLFSRKQHMIYDLVNYGVWQPLIYPNEVASVWLTRHPRLKRLCSWATAHLGSWVASWPVSDLTATHHFVVARRSSGTAITMESA